MRPQVRFTYTLVAQRTAAVCDRIRVYPRSRPSAGFHVSVHERAPGFSDHAVETMMATAQRDEKLKPDEAPAAGDGVPDTATGPPAGAARAAAPVSPAQTDPLRSVHTSNLPAILDQLGISLVVSTYQAGRVILVRNDGGRINTHFRAYERPMGVAADAQRMAIGAAKTRRSTVVVCETAGKPVVARLSGDGPKTCSYYAFRGSEEPCRGAWGVESPVVARVSAGWR